MVRGRSCLNPAIGPMYPTTLTPTPRWLHNLVFGGRCHAKFTVCQCGRSLINPAICTIYHTNLTICTLTPRCPPNLVFGGRFHAKLTECRRDETAPQVPVPKSLQGSET